MRFRFYDRPTHIRSSDRTARDPAGNRIEVEDASEPIAMFTSGHTPQQHDDGLGIHTASGEKVATFHGAGEHVARVQSDGALHVFKAQTKTQDAPMSTRLAAINQLHTEFYRRKE